MATYVKSETWIQKVWNKEVDIFGTTEVLKALIHTDAFVAATDDEAADLSQVTGTGYTALGIDIQNDSTRTGATVTMTAADAVWTAGASDWIAARYFAVIDDTATGDPIMCDHDYGANFTLLSGETMTWDVGASLVASN